MRGKGGAVYVLANLRPFPSEEKEVKEITGIKSYILIRK